MNRKYFFVIVAIAISCVFLIFISMWNDAKTKDPAEGIVVLHSISPFKASISGVGIVEPSSENILIGTPINRIVEKVYVTVGMKVKKGDPLFSLEARDLESDLTLRKIENENAQAKLKKLEEMPRPEDLSSAEGALKSAQVELAEAKSQHAMVEGLTDKRAVSQQEINRRLFNFQQAEAKEEQARAAFDKIKAGAWKPDLMIAKLDVLQAQANVERVKTDIQRTIIRSPIDGTVLQIKIHEGELPPQDPLRNPIMIVGDTEEMHLRVSINQFDAINFSPQAPAVAFLQGDGRLEFPLKFVRVEPYLVNKQNLTNDITEKVDTRVLQIIYSFKRKDHLIFVGQQMDVFIEAQHAH